MKLCENFEKKIFDLMSLFSAGTAASFFVALLVFTAAANASAQAITEGFDDITTLSASGWVIQNNSSPAGTKSWFQGNPASFPAQSGASNSYIGVDALSTSGTGTISNWLLTPNRTFKNGDVIKFWTQTGYYYYPDRLEFRLSTNGASTNVGTTETSVGDFTTVLLTINPNLQRDGYPDYWSEYTAVLSGLPAGGVSGRAAFRYYVTDGGPSGANSYSIGIDSFSYLPFVVPDRPQHIVDFNGDGKSDFAVVRNITGGAGGQIRWFINLNSSATTYGSDWGIVGDYFLPVDYDGDGKSDIAVWRPSNTTFYILQSATNTLKTDIFGLVGDDPSVVGDYDGDGKADVAVYRAGANSGDQSYWFYRGSLNNPAGNITYVQWGLNGDFVAPGDYDGDGKNDFVIQRNAGGGQARFWMSQTTAGFKTQVFGFPTDVIVPGDYDGDGKTDLSVVRGSGGQFSWWQLRSSDGAAINTVFGLSASDYLTQGDYDGDGKTDVAIWRPSATAGQSAFWLKGSTGNTFAIPFGANGDYPAANYNRH